jgi:hypothetical protein
MTGQTAIVRLFFGERFEADDLGDVAAALNVERARTVARLAAVAIFQRRLEMGGMFEILFVKLFMAGLASIASDVLACCGVVWRSLLLLFIRGSCPDNQEQGCSQ